MRPVHLEDRCQFKPEKFWPKLVHGSPRARAFLLCLEPGQGLPPRQDSEEMVCYLLRGKAKLIIAGEPFEASAGDFAAAEAGDTRGIEAEERCVALWVHISTGGNESD